MLAPLQTTFVCVPLIANCKGCVIVTEVEGLQLLVASATETVYVPAGKFERTNVRVGEANVETACV